MVLLLSLLLKWFVVVDVLGVHLILLRCRARHISSNIIHLSSYGTHAWLVGFNVCSFLGDLCYACLFGESQVYVCICGGVCWWAVDC